MQRKNLFYINYEYIAIIYFICSRDQKVCNQSFRFYFKNVKVFRGAYFVSISKNNRYCSEATFISSMLFPE